MFQGFLTRSDTNWDVQLEIEKIGRLESSGGGGGGGGLEVEGLYVSKTALITKAAECAFVFAQVIKFTNNAAHILLKRTVLTSLVSRYFPKFWVQSL